MKAQQAPRAAAGATRCRRVQIASTKAQRMTGGIVTASR